MCFSICGSHQQPSHSSILVMADSDKHCSLEYPMILTCFSSINVRILHSSQFVRQLQPQKISRGSWIACRFGPYTAYDWGIQFNPDDMARCPLVCTFYSVFLIYLLTVCLHQQRPAFLPFRTAATLHRLRLFRNGSQHIRRTIATLILRSFLRPCDSRRFSTRLWGWLRGNHFHEGAGYPWIWHDIRCCKSI